MEINTAVKSGHLSLGVRRINMMEGEEALANTCVKRRRRNNSSAPAITCSIEGDQQQKQPQADQATTVGSVKRSSRFRGVSRHRWTGRFEAHLWDKGTWNPTQRKKGKQVYLGAYDEEESAARSNDLAALKYWGTSSVTNFPVSDYEKEIVIMNTDKRRIPRFIEKEKQRFFKRCIKVQRSCKAPS